MSKWAVPASAGALALVFLIAAVAVHTNHKPASDELLQAPHARQQALSALSGGKIPPALYAVESAYTNGFKHGEAAAQAAEAPHHAPALAQGWRRTALARLRAESELKKTENARVEMLQARRIALAEHAEEASEPAAWHAYSARLAEGAGGEGGKMQLAMQAEKRSWRKDGLKLQQRAALAEDAERDSERTAELHWAAAQRKAAAEQRLARMHSALQQHYTEQLSQVRREEGEAEGRAARLVAFCAGQFPAEDGLRKFCFDKLSEPPQGHSADQLASVPLRDAEFSGHTLGGAIARAHAAGEEGMPKYVVFHPAHAQAEAFELKPVELIGAGGGAQPSLAQQRVQRAARDELMQQHEQLLQQQEEEEMRSMQEAAPSRPVEVNGASLQDAIARAHAMGLKGEPELVVYHPEDRAPEVFKLVGEGQRQ